MSHPWWNTEVSGDFAFSNNHGTTLHDELLELIFYLPSYNKWIVIAQMNPLFLWVLSPWRAKVIFWPTFELLHYWHLIKVGSCWLITWSSFHLIWHLSDVLWYLMRVMFCHPQISYLIGCGLWLILNAGGVFYGQYLNKKIKLKEKLFFERIARILIWFYICRV